MHFSRQKRWRRLKANRKQRQKGNRPETNQPVTHNGNLTNGFPQLAKKVVTSTKETSALTARTANEPTFAKLVGGNILRPIAQVSPAKIISPFPIETWRDCLKTHPDRNFVNTLLDEIQHGVRVGFQNERRKTIDDNHLSAKNNPTPIARELERELSLNRKAGPFLEPPFPNFVGSPMGAVPKKHSKPQKWRIINDLSWPAGQSVNDGISKEQYTCSYDSLDLAISQLKLLGPNTLMSKLDLSDAFRHILVHKNDWELLGSTWPIEINGETRLGYFFDMFLPFGLRSSPALFLKFVSVLRYVIEQRKAHPVWNYLDDFWTCGPEAKNTCAKNLNIMLQSCSDLGFKVNPAKTVQPTTNLLLLGIELDTQKQEASIDTARLSDTLALLNIWSSKTRCKKRQLQSLIGKLHFICKVCRPGRSFLRRMINLLSKASHPSHHIRLTGAFQKDINWWLTFLPTWNGCSFFFDDEWISSSTLELYSDACKDSFGAYFSGDWLMGSFHDYGIPLCRSITFKELYALTAAVNTWAYRLDCRNILFHCDNMSVVNILSSGTSKCPHIMSLVRYLFYVCAQQNIMLRAVHIPGIRNCWADAISRLQVEKFLTSCPQASPQPTAVKPIDLLNFN